MSTSREQGPSIQRTLEDLHTRTSYAHPRRTLARAHVRFHKTLRAPRQMNIENVKNNVLPRLSHFFAEVYKVLRLPRKMTAKNTSHFHPRLPTF